jgi:calcineurin-like phosphoesterase
MCGESGGVLGMNPELVVKHQRCRTPIKFEPASGAPKATGAIFDVDESSGKVRSIERITF